MERRSVISTDGERLSFSVSGSGRPVILLHGFTMWSEMWQTNGVVDYLSDSARLIAPDMRGHGYSSKPHDPARYGITLVNDIVAILDHEGIDNADLVGFSAGAELALKFATTYPARVSSLFIIGSGWTGMEDIQMYREFAEWARETGNAMTLDPDYDAMDAFVEGMTEVIGLPRAALENVSVQCAGIAGGDDPHLPHLERLVGVIPGFSLDVLPDLPHETSWRDGSIPKRIETFLRLRQG